MGDPDRAMMPAFPCPHDITDALERVVARCFSCGEWLPEGHEAHTLFTGEVLPCCRDLECQGKLSLALAEDERRVA